MAHLASTAPLSLLAAEALASGLARDAERFRHAGDDGTLLAERLAQVVSDLPPVLFEKLVPHLDWHCTLALHKLASSLPKASKDLVACHLPYAQAEEEERARFTLRADSLSLDAAAAVDARLLVDVYAQPELFVHEPPAGQLVVAAAHRARGAADAELPGEPSVVSEAQFWSNFHKFVLDQLEGLDWTGVVMAGGAVLACATTQPAKSRYGDKVVLEHLLRYNPSALEHLDSPQDYATFLALHSPDSPTTSSDIDLYLYGFDSEEALLAKQRELAEVIKRNAEALGAEVYATRTRAAVTLFSAFPYRSVQIVIGAKAKCATEVVLDFDLDCCALCFDGTRLLALPRAMLALNRRCNTLRADKNSFVKLATSRLLKYGDRGFATAIAERFFIEPVLGDAHGGTLDDARAVKLLRFSKMQLLSLHIDSCRGGDWLTGNIVPTRPTRKALSRKMMPQDDIYASAGEFCVAELMKRVLNLDYKTYDVDYAGIEDERRAFDVQLLERPRPRSSGVEYTGFFYSGGKCIPYGAPVDNEWDNVVYRSSARIIRGVCPTSIKALGGVPATTAQTAEVIEALGWVIAKTDAEVVDMAQSATAATHMFNDVAPGVGCHAYTCAPQVDGVRLVVDASATSVLRSGGDAVSFDLPNMAGCDWRLDLSTLKDLIQPRADGDQFDRDALMLALTMVRVSDGDDPMLDTYQTSLWPPLEQCPAEERVRHAYKLLLVNVVLDVENPDGLERKIQLDDTYAFHFARYGADGVNTHINGADVHVPPVTAPLDVLEAAVEPSPHDPAEGGPALMAEDDSGTADLVPSRTWRNYIYWDFITPHATIHADAAEENPEWVAPVLVDAAGKLRLRLRLQVTRIERKRDLTPFSAAE